MNNNIKKMNETTTIAIEKSTAPSIEDTLVNNRKAKITKSRSRPKRKLKSHHVLPLARSSDFRTDDSDSKIVLNVKMRNTSCIPSKDAP